MLLDQFNNLVTTEDRSVSLSLVSNTEGALVSGNLVASMHVGIATIDGFSIDRASPRLQLEISAEGLAPGRSDPFLNLEPAAIAPADVPGGIAFAELAGAGGDFRCGRATDETAWCWGINDQGQLGTGTTSSSAEPVQVGGGHRFARLRQSWALTCGLDTGRETWCWGEGHATPFLIDSTLAFTDVDVGGAELCGLAAGRPWCAVVLQNDGTNPPSTPFAPAFTDSTLRFTMLSVSGGRVCGLTSAGAIYCNDGLATGDSYTLYLPQPESQGMVFTSVTGDAFHTCALATDGTAWCWGWNLILYEQEVSGELGTDGSSLQTAPAPVRGGHRFSALSAGFGHTCGIETGGQVYCWGSDRFGEIGSTWSPEGVSEGGGYPYTNTPVPIASTSTYQQIDAGRGHSCALTGTTARCWGGLAAMPGRLSTPPPGYAARMSAVIARIMNSRDQVPAASQRKPGN
jgi:alpha-tubulin suppressor-like RCC1 family protein